jgi:hypothetical protein
LSVTYSRTSAAASRTTAAAGLATDPDLGSGCERPDFVRDAHRQSTLVAASEQERDDQAFVDAVSADWDDDT